MRSPINTISNAFPKIPLEIYDSYMQGDMQKARDAQVLANQVRDLLKNGPYLTPYKEVVKLIEGVTVYGESMDFEKMQKDFDGIALIQAHPDLRAMLEAVIVMAQMQEGEELPFKVLQENPYKLIDVDGERTVWGFWNPEILNEDPWHYLENGLNALEITSFLKVTHYITGDPKYQEHYLRLMQDHDYLSNILTTKKQFPDETNHSDDQLGFCAWYPILQIERDPKIRMKLHQGVRRHWLAEEPERPSFFTFVYATIDPNHADIGGAIQNLMEIPEDRRNWRMENSHRADVSRDPRSNRFDHPMLRECLPADERNFEKWNNDPFEPDDGDENGLTEFNGATYLLPYWMGRYHGFFAEE